PALKNNRITGLFEDRMGTLWIGHETGNLTRLQSGIFSPVEVPGGWSAGKILRIGTDEDDDIWLVNKEGFLARLKDGRFLSPMDRGGRAPGLVASTKEAEGKLWVLRGGQPGVLEKGQLTPLLSEEGTREIPVQAICSSRDGGLWTVSGGRLRKW